ncbi:MAG: amidohydrolase family protein [Candidatus Tectomicrobia bacterium]|uniref:Amidohydrolase family protein n=1 Tax=Tectimicrobiota bacterium TaxID=2528274 RepID=A0A933GME2_UNCTE|nr:amidohydrolase family protein [Candidatus Tectomicrobia bacterium]
MSSKFEVIDVHVHTYPTAQIGLQAMSGINHCGFVGLPEESLAVMAKGLISKTAMLNLTPVAEMTAASRAKYPKNMTPEEKEKAEKELATTMTGRIFRRNKWTCDTAKTYPSLIPFISIDPIMDTESMVKAINEGVACGAKGIKLHPGAGYFYPNHRTLWPAYRRAQDLGLPIIAHSGRFFHPENIMFAQPRHFEDVAINFPKLKLGLAHLGNGFLDETRILAQKYPNLFFDCSVVISPREGDPALKLKAEDLVELMRFIGVERVLFGTDFPWYDPNDCVKRVEALPLSLEEKRLIFADNAKRILQL